MPSFSIGGPSEPSTPAEPPSSEGGMSDLTSQMYASMAEGGAPAAGGAAKPDSAAAKPVSIPVGPDGKKIYPAFSCYKNAYWNGKGNGLYWCKDNEEAQLTQCYPKCPKG